ncbi:uncharacterized protein LOC100679258 [Nasonia vitripennis]|uniref:Secreted protein n=1 Tax=Nasonia vitripennis TaxID=7425 RepID=A0A7M7GL33_NASVI|nr:uncharacterized protein LOC100679258 [Nasonia vitripennis]XP_008213820.1 uncharacterized protein LOC100679258 [Nasonia vitripennis]XP_016840715.1 uncharacterized protein LOC100679258 [Nasonia vitripennis]
MSKTTATTICIIAALTFSLLLDETAALDLLLGNREPGDKLLQKSRMYDAIRDPEGPAILWKVLTGDGKSTISQLVIRDRTQGCGTVVPINGGPGSKFVVLQLISAKENPSSWDCTSDYSVEIYGL